MKNLFTGQTGKNILRNFIILLAQNSPQNKSFPLLKTYHETTQFSAKNKSSIHPKLTTKQSIVFGHPKPNINLVGEHALTYNYGRNLTSPL